MTSTDTLYRLSRDMWSDPDGVADQLRTMRLPKRLPTRLAHLAIVQGQPFTAGNISADRMRGYAYSGRLPSDWQSTFARDVRDGAFVIYSYGTPIAWERADGLRVIPPVSYSVTTARHQSEVRRAWDMGWGGRGAQTYSHPTRDMSSL